MVNLHKHDYINLHDNHEKRNFQFNTKQLGDS